MGSRKMNHDSNRGSRRLQFQDLEPRSLMAADLGLASTARVSGSPAESGIAIVAPASLPASTSTIGNQVSALTLAPWDDRFENNDTMLQATRLGTISSAETHSGLRMMDSADFYSFRLVGQPAAGAHLTLNFQHWQGDLDVRLYNTAGQVIRSSTGVGNSERISLEGLAAGEYIVKVYGYNGAYNPNYSMTIDPRQMADDRFEENDTMLQAARLGTINSVVTHTDLRMRDAADFYSFRLIGQPAAGAHLTLNFQHWQGDIDVHLYNTAGQLIRSSTGVGNSERISLEGLAAGEYIAKVYGYNGAHNPNYSMTIDPRQMADDRFEENDTMLQATRLGTIVSTVTHSNLRMMDAADFYSFRLLGQPAAGAHLTLNFQHWQGDIDVRLYNTAGQLIRSSAGVGNSERISLEGLAAGEYIVKVYGYNGATNPSYSMTINPGSFFRSRPAVSAIDAVFGEIGTGGLRF